LIRNVELVGTEILIRESDEDESSSSDVLEGIELDPTSSVFETNLGPHAFEVVTPKKILHFISESEEMSNLWILSVRSTISTCELDLTDPFIKTISQRIQLDLYYEVEFRENKPLGVVLERSHESAIVKMSNFKESGIEVGSVLTSINEINVSNRKYQETISYLKQWKVIFF
jgi:hypothetical protein